MSKEKTERMIAENPAVDRAYVEVLKALVDVGQKPLALALAFNDFFIQLSFAKLASAKLASARRGRVEDENLELDVDDAIYAVEILNEQHQVNITSAQVEKVTAIAGGFDGLVRSNHARGSIFRTIFWDDAGLLASRFAAIAKGLGGVVAAMVADPLKRENIAEKMGEDRQVAEEFIGHFAFKTPKSADEMSKIYIAKIDKLAKLAEGLADVSSLSQTVKDEISEKVKEFFEKRLDKVIDKIEDDGSTTKTTVKQERSAPDINYFESELAQVVKSFEADLAEEVALAGKEKSQKFQEGLAKLHMEKAKHKKLKALAKEKFDSGEALNKKKLRKLYIKEVSDVLKKIVSEYKFLKPAVGSLKGALKAYEAKFEKAVTAFFGKSEAERNLKEFLLNLEVMTDNFKHELVKEALPDNYNIDSPQEFKHALVLLLLKETLLNEAQQEGLVIAEVDTHAKHLHRLSKESGDKASVKGDALLELANDLKITKNVYTGNIRDAKFTNAADYMKLREGFKGDLKEKIKAKLQNNPALSKHRRWATKMGTFVLNLSMVVFSGGIAFGVGIARKLMGKSFLRSFHTTTEKLLTKPGKAKDAAKGAKWGNVEIKNPSI